jgi:hypothetical protein
MAKSLWTRLSQHLCGMSGSQRARGGLHCTKVKMMSRVEKSPSVIIENHKAPFIQLSLGPVIRLMSNATEILPVESPRITNT